MTALWDAKGNRLPVTILQVSRAQVTSVKTLEKNGYWAVQVGIGLRRPENVSKAMLGHFAAARVAPKMHVGEFRVRDKSGLLPIGKLTNGYVAEAAGSEIDVNHFYEGQFVDVRGRGYLQLQDVLLLA
jgi:large subunit ribosomal protein L3